MIELQVTKNGKICQKDDTRIKHDDSTLNNQRIICKYEGKGRWHWFNLLQFMNPPKMVNIPASKATREENPISIII